MKRICAIILSTLAALSASASSSETEKIDYTPHIHGVLRTRLEVNTTDGEYRFQVRNARVTLDGKIASWADYFIQTDLCDQGKMKILDAYARITPSKNIFFQAGQFRMPFGVESFRGPATYIFANRSFMGKQMCNYRAVGFKTGYKFSNIPVGIEAGLFNPSAIGDHTGWHKDIAFGSKLWYKLRNVTFTTGFQSIHPSAIRANLVDASVAWHTDRWQVEAEYMYEHYAYSAHKAAHSYVAFADYRFPIKAWKFNRLSFQARFDGITAHSSAIPDDNGHLITNNPACNRVTLGSTISYIHTKSIWLDIRANYEKYFHHSSTSVTSALGDKAVLELVFRF